jgi:CdvA-like coiled-coil domain
MSELKLEFVGKKAKDMYGTYIGKVVGIMTDIEGATESVGVDCGAGGIKNLPYEQLLVQGDYVIFIPRWRLDAQKLLREKSMTLKRIKALQEIVADNDNMKDDAELVHLKYEKRLDSLSENTREIVDKLLQRISELDLESKRVRMVLFDAKLQYKSNEITEDLYQQINMNTNELLDHVNLEKTEINNIMNKLTQHTVENTVASTNETPREIQMDDKEALENGQMHGGEQQQQHEEELNNRFNQNQDVEEDIEIKKEVEESIQEISGINGNQNEGENNIEEEGGEIRTVITPTNQ